MQSTLEGLWHISAGRGALYALIVLWTYFNWEGSRDDSRREAAFAEHIGQPNNPIHLARFVALSSMAASKRTAANVSFAAWVTLSIFNALS